MKKYLFLTLLVLFTFLSAHSQTSYAGIPGCVAHWNFTSNGIFSSLPDVSGNGNDGSIYNVTAVAGFKGIANKAGKFNGYSSYALVPDNSNLNPSTITVIALIKFDSFNSNTCQGNNIMYKGYDHSTSTNWEFFSTDNNYDQSCFAYTPTKQLLNFRTGATSPSTYSLYDTEYIVPGQWYFMAAEIDSSNTVTLYQVPFNTSAPPNTSVLPPVAVINNGGGLPQNNYNLFIGKTQNPPYPYWVNGVYDDLAIFNRALSNYEIRNLVKYLWGTTAKPGNTTGINSLDGEDDFNVLCYNKTVHIIDPYNTYKEAHIFDMEGRQLLSSSSKDINVDYVQPQILIVQCVFSNNQRIFKKVALQ